MSDAIQQSMEVLRQAEGDTRALHDQITTLRQKYADARLELERVKQELRKSENTCSHLQGEVEKKQQTVDVVVKELTSKKGVVDHLTVENARLKSDIARASQHQAALSNDLRSRVDMNVELVKQADTPAALYMNMCFAVDCTPSVEVLKSLYSSSTIAASAKPISYQEMSTLCDVLKMKSTINTGHWKRFDTLDIWMESEESCTLLGDIIMAMEGLKSLTVHHIGDKGAVSVAHAISCVRWIETVSFPNMAVTDVGFEDLMEAIHKRNQLSGADSPHATITMREVDLGSSRIDNPESWRLIRGETIGALNLSNQATLSDQVLADVLSACPGVTALALQNCTALTNDAVEKINTKGSHVSDLNVLGCPGITTLRLANVTVLHTTMKGVAYVECPVLASLAQPIQFFHVVGWNTPNLTELTVKDVTLGQREFTILGDLKSLKTVNLLNCKLSSLMTFLRKLRGISSACFRGSRGVTDADLAQLSSAVTSLDVGHGIFLTDSGVAKVAENCPRLARLSLKKCANITDQGLLAFEKCPMLTHLNVLGCKKITVISIQRLVSTVSGIAEVVHETFLSPKVTTLRSDEEEAELVRIEAEERALHARRERLTEGVSSPRAGGFAQVSTSPVRSNMYETPTKAPI